MKTIKIDEDDYCKLRAITKAYGIFIDEKETIQDTLHRLIGYEWDNPAYACNGEDDADTAKAMEVHKAEYERLINKML